MLVQKPMFVKEWIIDKAQDTAARYNCYIDTEKREDGMGTKVSKDGFVKVYVLELLSETEKAVQVRLDTGGVVGSNLGWKLWIPKSQMKAEWI